ncbi:MAG TPA: hypothetical protein ENK10_09105 [Acidobacteria bacterium]|nr:hypothetical protein [Acidobacteriota bacterium]
MSVLAPPEAVEAALEERETTAETPAQESAAVVDPPADQAEAADDAGDEATGVEEEVTEVAEPPVDPRRVAALEPFLGKLQQLLAEHRDLESPSQLRIGDNSLHITRWERETCLLVLEEGGAGQQGWVLRVADAIAVQARCLVVLDRLRLASDAGVTAPTEIRQEIVLTEAIGKAVGRELQKVVDRMVVSGEMAPAKRLSGLRNRLKSVTDSLRDVLDPEEKALAEEMAEAFLAVPSDAILPEPKKRRRRRRARTEEFGSQAVIHSAPIGRERTKVRLYTAILLSLAAAWSVLVLWPMLQKPQIERLDLGDFRSVSEVSEILVRPPSLFVTLDAGQWDRLGPAQRSFAITAASRVAESKGYTGVVFTTSDGRRVAQWLARTGVTIFPPGQTDS